MLMQWVWQGKQLNKTLVNITEPVCRRRVAGTFSYTSGGLKEINLMPREHLACWFLISEFCVR